jgi:sugar lactone lactonase YvrE
MRVLVFLLAVWTVAAQDLSHLQVEEVATGFAGGEGPVWSRAGYLLFSDYDKDRIYKYVPGKTPEVPRGLARRQWQQHGPAGPPLYL